MAVQIFSPKAPALQQTGSFTASRPRSEVRDTLENYLNPEGTVGKSTTYGQQVSGYAEFLKDAKFRDAVAVDGMTDAYFATLSNDQKHAYASIRNERAMKAHDTFLAYNIEKRGQNPTAIQQPAGGISVGSMLHSELNAGIIDNLKAVDRAEKAGVSPNTWADAFRARVTSLDHHFDLLRRTYEFQGKDTAEITAQYEKGLGDLYDYAKARDAGQIYSPKARALQQTGSSTASGPRSDVRNTLENYLNPEGTAGKSTTYGQQVSGYAELLKDAKFRDAGQISSLKAPALQQTGSFTASRPRSEVRDTLENYLNPEGTVGKSTTYGQQVSGYAEFLKDAKFRDAVAVDGMTDAYFATLSNDQKHAYASIRNERAMKAHDTFLAYNIEKRGQNPTAIQQPAGGISVGSMLHSELNSGAINNLKAVDREEKAGISPTTWADAFRSQVTSLDHHFDLLRRTYEFQGEDTAEITAQYEKGLGDLYDYAKARDAGHA